MREPLDNNVDNNGQGHFIAWAVAIVFLGLIAAPTLLSKHSAGVREPGIVDVGTPGAAVKSAAVPPSAAVSEESTPLADWAHDQGLHRGSIAQGHRESKQTPNAEANGRTTTQPAM